MEFIKSNPCNPKHISEHELRVRALAAWRVRQLTRQNGGMRRHYLINRSSHKWMIQESLLYRFKSFKIIDKNSNDQKTSSRHIGEASPEIRQNLLKQKMPTVMTTPPTIDMVDGHRRQCICTAAHAASVQDQEWSPSGCIRSQSSPKIRSRARAGEGDSLRSADDSLFITWHPDRVDDSLGSAHSSLFVPDMLTAGGWQQHLPSPLLLTAMSSMPRINTLPRSSPQDEIHLLTSANHA